MNKNNYLINVALGFIISSFFLPKLPAQEISIRECIDIAITNNLSIKMHEMNVRSANNTFKMARNQKLPSLNYASSYGYNFGFAIDPTTNIFSTQTNQILSGGIDLQVPVYNFGQLRHQQRQAGIQVLSSEAVKNQEIRTISLNIAQAYLETILQEEQIANDERNLKLTKEQVARIAKLFEAGAVPEGDLLNAKAQLSTDQQQLINDQNQYKLNLLNLKNLMNFEGDFIPIIPDIFKNEIQDVYEALSLDGILEKAINNDLRILNAQLNIEIQKEQVEIDKRDLYPSLNIFGNVSSRYSSLGQRLDRIDIVQRDANVIIFGQTETITQEIPVAKFEDAPFDYQLRNNRGEAVGVRLTIPIYNKNQLRGKVKEAEINVDRSLLNSKLTEQQITQEITLSHQSYLNAKASYFASKASVRSQERAYDNALAAYNYGAINAFEYSQNRTLNDNVQSSFLQAKYNYIFSILVLDFYLGKPL